ncbi:MAG TPA: capsule assembly Wzi family protein [Gemmatimonadaceae bacterium]|nr:capsule assembly Wzi family protein [Gemmatimonadaceae bacterium]
MRTAVLLIVCLAAQASPQSSAGTGTVPQVGSVRDEYERLMQLTGVMPLASLMLRPGDHPVNFQPPDSAQWRSPWASRLRAPDSARIELFAPELRSTYNSAVPYGTNDGAMWAGRGVSALATLGARARVGPLDLQVAPEVTWSKNNWFALAPLVNAPANASPYADPVLSRRIDLPQRFGEHAFARGRAGQSHALLTLGALKAGVATENMWWGPGVDNSLLMTNNAPGFTHTVLGTSRPVNVRVGRLELLHTLGWLKQSSYWRALPDTTATDRWLNALSIVFEPAGARGLYLGATRMYYAYQRYNPITLREIASTIVQTPAKHSLVTETDTTGNDIRDQMFAAWWRWVHPGIGLELYGEWGRNDHGIDTHDYLVDLFHSRAYLLGGRKVRRVGDGLLSARLEWTVLDRTRSEELRATPYWYAHHLVRQGYTNEGQTIGAGIGPSGDEQTLAVDWYAGFGSVGLVLQRHQVNSDQLYVGYLSPNTGYAHDIFAGAGPRGTMTVRGVDISASLLLQREFDRYHVERNDVGNVHFDLRAVYAR